jgi:hypothetical protein
LDGAIPSIRPAEDRHLDPAVVILPFDPPVAGREPIFEYFGWFAGSGIGFSAPSRRDQGSPDHPGGLSLLRIAIRRPSDNRLIGSKSIPPMPSDPPILFGTPILFETLARVRELMMVLELRVEQLEQSAERQRHREKNTQ